MDINKQPEVHEEPSDDNVNLTLGSWMECQESVIRPTPLTRQESVAAPTPLMRYDTVASTTPLTRQESVAWPTPLMRYDTIAAPTPLTRQTSGFMTPQPLMRPTTTVFMKPPPLVRETTTGFVNPSLLRRTYDEPCSSPPCHDAFYQPLEDQIRELRKQINDIGDKLDNVIYNMR